MARAPKGGFVRSLGWGIPAIGLPLLLAAAALGQGVPVARAPEAALRLTPSLDPVPQTQEVPLRAASTAPAPLPAPLPASAPAAQPLSFGPQRIRYANGVNATFDIIYANLLGYRPLTLDLYLPAQRGLPARLVVFVHGGV